MKDNLNLKINTEVDCNIEKTILYNNMIWLTHTDGDRNSYYVGKDYFQKLENNKIYTLKELGLYE